MYCPQCSQQQVSDEMRFCARCGFPLSAVRELIASGGVLLQRETVAQGPRHSPRRKAVRKGGRMMLASLPLLLVVGILSSINDGFAVFALLPLLCFVVGFLRMLYGLFLAGRTPSVKRNALQSHAVPIMPARLGTAATHGPELPLLRNDPAETATPQRVKTAEMIRPPSITENTTRLLDEEADSHRG